MRSYPYLLLMTLAVSTGRAEPLISREVLTGPGAALGAAIAAVAVAG